MIIQNDKEIQSRHVDLIWGLWHVFDITPEGRGETWYP